MTTKQNEVKTSVDTAPSVENMFEDILKQLNEQKVSVSNTINNVKKLQKEVNKNLKKKQKGGKKREPSGFTKPTKITKELAEFIGKENGVEVARTEVTKLLSEYIKNNKLQLESDKRKIIPDKKLCKLLSCKKDDDVTYFNLQRWLKPHFIATPATPAKTA